MTANGQRMSDRWRHIHVADDHIHCGHPLPHLSENIWKLFYLMSLLIVFFNFAVHFKPVNRHLSVHDMTSEPSICTPLHNASSNKHHLYIPLVQTITTDVSLSKLTQMTAEFNNILPLTHRSWQITSFVFAVNKTAKIAIIIRKCKLIAYYWILLGCCHCGILTGFVVFIVARQQRWNNLKLKVKAG